MMFLQQSVTCSHCDLYPMPLRQHCAISGVCLHHSARSLHAKGLAPGYYLTFCA
ncbi:hypothetical protein JOE27_004548 [Pseudomonas sp. M5]|uniref:Uncharacterized protein n=1 Tax=Pseudomonas putida TaxID=303 RepID=A0A379KDS2_PSEPU|nr:hypothetical protein [Pseudomonas sp. M2]MBM7399793.1 hypothetical protein [Pseudomonas sp. M5]SUD66095.1 Uncharacterised protein [Pseudomonas putida]